MIIGVISGIGSGTRWYRTIFLEEINKDYVRTARSKGLSEQLVLFKHVLRNALIPILTGVVVVLPMLFMGSLLVESFFGIPGLGSYTIDAINRQDFAIVRSMVYLGSVLYIIGLLLTDIFIYVSRPSNQVELSMPFQPVILLTDALFFFLTVCLIAFILFARKREHISRPWKKSVQKNDGGCVLSRFDNVLLYSYFGFIALSSALGSVK